MAKRQIAMGNKNYAGVVDKHGRWTGKINLIPEVLEKPMHWRKPRTVFVCSMCDLFHEDVPLDYIYRVFAMMQVCHRHTFKVLTKRAERMHNCMMPMLDTDDFWSYVEDLGGDTDPSSPLFNVHMGVSIENQPTADERIPWLLKTPAAVRWVSYEPALGPVGFWKYWRWIQTTSGIDGIVMGCESGPGARPMNLDWVLSVRDQCQEAGAPFFLKQMMVDGKKVSMPKLDGKVWDELPKASG